MWERFNLFNTVFYKAVSLLVVVGFTLSFFLSSNLMFFLFLVLGLVTAQVWIGDLWFRSLEPVHKIFWTILIVFFNIISMPVYWFLFVRSGRGLNGARERKKPLERLDESFLCGIVGVFTGPFALIPGVLLAHVAGRNRDDLIDRSSMLRWRRALGLNYGLLVIWSVLIVMAVREYFTV